VGLWNGKQNKDLQLTFDNVNLNKVTPNIEKFKFDGNLNGKINFKQSNTIFQPTSTLRIDSLKVNDIELGKLNLNIKGDETLRKFHLNSKLRFLTFKDQESIKLSPKENELLKLLVLYENDLMSRELALTKIWRDDNYFTSRSMDVYIAKLRKYLKLDANVEILNIHGEGFRLVIKNKVSDK
jgi:DNA-binding winged helix-turn-helix (wHTH) protein